MDQFLRNRQPSGGGALSRQISVSYNVHNNLDYTDFFRRNTNKQEGWLDVRVGSTDHWNRQWFVFEDSVLRYGPSRIADPMTFSVVPMDRVISIRTDNAYGNRAFLLTTTETKLHLRADSDGVRNDWLFSFQKSVALVLSHIMATTKPADMLLGAKHTLSPSTRSNKGQASSGGDNGADIWLHELGYGHGKHSFLLNKRRSSFTGNGAEEVAAASSVNDAEVSEITGRQAGAGGRSMSHGDLLRKEQPNISTAIAGVAAPVAISTTTSVFSALSLAVANSEIQSNSQIEPAADTSASGNRAGSSFWERPVGERSHVNLAEMYSGETGNIRTNLHYDTGSSSAAPIRIHQTNAISGSYTGMSGIGLSLSLQQASTHGHSNAIPIAGSAYDQNGWGGAEKLASSFKESRNSILNNADINRRVVMEEVVDEYEASPRLLTDVDSEVDSEEMFQMEDTPASFRARVPSNSGQPLNLDLKSPNSSGAQDLSRHRAPLPFTAALGLAEPEAVTMADANMRWLSGYCTRLGPRSKNEDRLIAIPDLHSYVETRPGSSTVASSSSASGEKKPTMPCGYFGVYDGHCGDQASIFIEQELHHALYAHPAFETDLESAVSETCVNLDKEFLGLCKQKKWCCGTTVLGAVVRNGRLLVFNIGDCQAVLCSNGIAKSVSLVHKPGREDEYARVVKANGWVTEESELYMARLHIMDLSDPLVRDKAQNVTFVKIHRVCGELAVSRSIGDPDYKNFTPGEKVLSPFLWPDDHNEIFYADPVIPNPEMVLTELTTADEFVIMASDGLWDVVSDQDAVNMTRASIEAGKTVSQAAEELCDLALRMGSSDNVTVVVVRFIHR